MDRLTECVQVEEPLLRAYSVAPGVINTDMQSAIRAMTPEQFPLVGKFRELERTNAFNSSSYVADWLLELAFAAQGASKVVVRIPPE